MGSLIFPTQMKTALICLILILACHELANAAPPINCPDGFVWCKRSYACCPRGQCPPGVRGCCSLQSGECNEELVLGREDDKVAHLPTVCTNFLGHVVRTIVNGYCIKWTTGKEETIRGYLSLQRFTKLNLG